MLPRCGKCGLPIRVHFAACWSSGIIGYQMPPGSEKPGAIITDPGEMRYCKPVDPGKIKEARKHW